ncbi:amidinotransferase [Kamptonema sp. UHCC 0994]|uniref:amidinotransferase n=1 Tax=Kamptonema sp. UHCC 0994 TaxID=3031329 RepID=UPI0023BA441F|nr:amidinotransferase [Kamptonema sp. UHCC 0994]MDF0556151.1 amidinotransferase [Kamptonema sp. UHCC 0994]
MEQNHSSQLTETTTPVVNSFNEWDTLEEVIVGRLDGAVIPPWHITVKATMPQRYWDLFRTFGGQLFPPEQIKAGEKELEELAHILESEGVKVRRPDAANYTRPYSTPDWESPSGLYGAMPRDVMIVVGDKLIEAPMPWRSRFFEINAYRSLIKEYFHQGAQWIPAPKPQLTDELYNYQYQEAGKDEEFNSLLTEFEPVFDAAEFARCGRDIFVQQSQVTNRFGIEWMRRILGDEYRIHELKFKDQSAMHIDATFVPMAPGKLLIHPEKADKLPEMFNSWDVRKAPEFSIPDDHPLYMSSKGVGMNLLSIDEQRVIVEKQDEPMIKMLKDWGFTPIPCNFRNFNTFGGSFHCATLDVRRKGTLQSYF